MWPLNNTTTSSIIPMRITSQLETMTTAYAPIISQSSSSSSSSSSNVSTTTSPYDSSSPSPSSSSPLASSNNNASLLLASTQEAVTSSNDVEEASAAATWDTVHQYTVMGVAVLGVVCCLLTAVVLTRKRVQSATNTVVTFMAFVNLVTMTSVLVYVMFLWKVTDFFTFGTYCTHYELAWLHKATTVTFAAGSISRNCLHTFLSIARYAVMLRGEKVTRKSIFTTQRACNQRAMFYSVLIISLVSFVAVVRGLETFHVEPGITPDHHHHLHDHDHRCYILVFTDKPTQSVISSLIVGVPVLSIPLFSSLVVWELRKIRRDRYYKSLRTAYFSRTSRDMLRSSKILIGLSVCHTLTETPRLCYHLVGGTFSFEYVLLCVLLGSIANFIIICVISRSIRHAFRDMFVCCKPSRTVIRQFHHHHHQQHTLEERVFRSYRLHHHTATPRSPYIVQDMVPQVAHISIEQPTALLY